MYYKITGFRVGIAIGEVELIIDNIRGLSFPIYALDSGDRGDWGSIIFTLPNGDHLGSFFFQYEKVI